MAVDLSYQPITMVATMKTDSSGLTVKYEYGVGMIGRLRTRRSVTLKVGTHNRA